MKTPRDWQQIEQHPLAAEYPNISGPAWERFVNGILKNGILPTANGRPRKVMLYEGKIIDGAQLHRACVQSEVVPEFEELKLPKGVTLSDWVEAANDNRRHESAEVMAVRASKRRERVASARNEGKSIRTIAAEEEVSEATVRADLEKSTAQGCAVDPPNGKVTGKDGKIRPATSPNRKKPDKPKTLKKAIEEEKEDVLKDENGQEIPPGIAPAFRGSVEFRGILNQLKEIKACARKLKDSAAGRHFRLQQFETDLDNARRTVRFDMPYAVCPVCKGQAKSRRNNCPCKDAGWLIESSYNNLPSELRA